MAFPKIQIVTITKRVPFRFDEVPATVRALATIPPLAMTHMRQLQIWFGIGEGPASGDQIECYILPGDLENPPDLASARERAHWAAVQNWEVAGAPASIVQTITHENLFVLDSDYSTIELADRIRNNQWLLVVSDTGNTQIYIGTITVEHNLIIRTWGNDAYTWDDIDVRNSEGLTEIDMDSS